MHATTGLPSTAGVTTSVHSTTGVPSNVPYLAGVPTTGGVTGVPIAGVPTTGVTGVPSNVPSIGGVPTTEGVPSNVPSTEAALVPFYHDTSLMPMQHDPSGSISIRWLCSRVPTNLYCGRS